MKTIEIALDATQRARYAERVGAYMLDVILNESIASVNQNSIEEDCGFVTAIDRWGAALRMLSWSRPGIPGAEELSAEEIENIERAASRRQGIKVLSQDLKNDRILKPALRGFPDWHGTVRKNTDDLLNNGTLDTARWLLTLSANGVANEDIAEHPFFVVATGFTLVGHLALSGAIVERTILRGDRHIPATRREALEAISEANTTVVSEALETAKQTDTAMVSKHGLCPAGRVRDEQGRAWVHILVGEGLKLFTAMTPEFLQKKEWQLPSSSSITTQS